MIEADVRGNLVSPRDRQGGRIVFLTKSRKANLDTADAAAKARAAGKAAQVAAKNAASAARAAAASAQVAAQNAAQKSQAAAQNAAVAAQNAAQKSTAAAQVAAQKSAEVAQKSQVAAQNASNTAQTTAAGVSKQVQQGVYTARSWAAPKLESVADYTATTVAPTVSSALRSTADYTSGTVAPTVSSALRNTAAQVRPSEPVSSARRRMASALTWSLLGAAVLAAAGAVTAVVRYRKRAAAEIDTEVPDGALGDTVTDAAGEPIPQATPTVTTPTAATPTSAEPVIPATNTSPSASANQTETVTDASVNGHANSSGW
jgi:trimeric autotransporter adhesin